MILCRPENFNSTPLLFYVEFAQFFKAMNYIDPQERDIRCIVMLAEGKHFCAGLDLKDASISLLRANKDKDQARNSLELNQKVQVMQDAFTYIETCRVPVLVGVQGGAIGAGVDLIAACDIVYCTQKSFYSIKEVDVGLAADLGSLQRLPLTASNWNRIKEYAFTGERFGAEEALNLGIVGRIFQTTEEMEAALMELAKKIATKSPVAVMGTKKTINAMKMTQVMRGLQQVREWNMSQLFSDDLKMAAMAFMTKTVPEFPRL